MIEAIHIGPEESGPLGAVDSVRAVAGQGLEGDRHFRPNGAKPGQALTLVEAENVADVGLGLGETRRNLTTRGVQLNDLVGKKFKVGDVECYGVELCEPCEHLQSMTRPGIIKDLVHRAGINADILSDGVIRVGDAISF
ncbi:MAG: MOSC domain-containing protein [Gaiellaceae bacterium]